MGKLVKVRRKYFTKAQKISILNELNISGVSLSELSLEREKKYADRIRIILLQDQGEPMIKIAEYFFLTERSVNNYKNRYKQGGLEKLLNDYYTGRSAYLSPEEQKRLTVELETTAYPNTKSVISYVKDEELKCSEPKL